jgi:Ca2+-binding EF-hand superfamily protein
MNAIDEYDVRECFTILDEDCQGSISVQDLQTIYLGLGFFLPEPSHFSTAAATRRYRMTCEELTSRHYRHFADSHGNHHQHQQQPQQQQQRLSLPVVLEILSHYSRNRPEHLHHSFQLLDRHNQGFVSVESLQQLAVAAASGDGADETKASTAAATVVAAPSTQPEHHENGDKTGQGDDLAQRMIHFFGSATNTKNKRDDAVYRMYPQDFQRIFQPPDP